MPKAWLLTEIPVELQRGSNLIGIFSTNSFDQKLNLISELILSLYYFEALSI